MNDFFEAEAEKMTSVALTASNEKKYAGLLVEIENAFIEMVGADEDSRAMFLINIADMSGQIWHTDYRDGALKELCKKYLGKKSEYDRLIKPMLREKQRNEGKNEKTTIYFDKENYKIIYYGGQSDSTIAEDFLIYIKYCLRDEFEDTRWVLELKRKTSSLTIEMSNDDFSSVKKIKTKLLSEKYSLMITESQLSQLHSFLLKQRIKDGKKIIRLGYDEDADAFIFSNGAYYQDKLHIANENGIIEIGDKAVSMPIFEKAKADKHWFRYIEPKESPMSLSDYYNYLSVAYDIDIATNVVAHYLFSVYRDIIVDYTKASPVLMLKGTPGSGKTSVARLVMALYGIPPNEGNVNLKSDPTPIGLGRTLSQYSNFPLWIDEYNPTSKYATHIEGKIQASYDNMGAIKAKQRGGNFNTGLETEGPPIKSSVLMTTNFFPEAEHFFSRCIFVPLSNQKKTNQQLGAYNMLKPYEQTGLSYITAHLQKYRSLVKKEFSKEYYRIYNDLRRITSTQDVPDRAVVNQAVILAALFVIQSKEMVIYQNCTISELRERIYSVATKQIYGQVNAMSDASSLRIFWEIMQKTYNENKLILNKEYKFDDSKTEPLLIIRFGLLYNARFKHQYQQLYRTTAPDKSTIEDEIAKFLGVDGAKEIYKAKTFVPVRQDMNEFGEPLNSKKVPYPDAIVFPYERLQEKFYVDFNLYDTPRHHS